MDRIFLAVITEGYTVMDGRIVLRLHPRIAPYDVGIFPLLRREQFIRKAQEINTMLKREGFSTYMDLSGKIGRCYSKADEIGVPYAVTIDHQTLQDNTVTIRFRDTRNQIRTSISDLPKKLRELISQY